MPVTDRNTRVFIASREPSTNLAIGMLISAQPDMEVAGFAGDNEELLSKIDSQLPDVVVLDWELLGRRMDTLDDLFELLQEPLAIIAMSVHETAREAAFALGVDGFVYKGAPPAGLLESIRAVRRKQKSRTKFNPTRN